MISFLAVSSMLLLAPPPEIAEAQEALPTHALTNCGNAQMMCFRLEPYKELLKLSNEVLTARQKVTLLESKVRLLEQENASLEAQLQVKEKQVTLWQDDHDRLLKKWEEESKKRHAAEVRADSPWPIVTMVVGGLLGASGALWGAFNSEEAAPWVLSASGAIVTTIGAIDFAF